MKKLCSGEKCFCPQMFY